MMQLLQNFLVWHVVLGLAGIAFSIALLKVLLTRGVKLKFLEISSLLALLSFLGSWLAGGYYYTIHYGKAVKPLIKAGDYGWVHALLMETKEHIFLFLPFLSAVAFLAIWLGSDLFSREPKFKKALTGLVLTVIILGVVITLFGVAISGAVNQPT